ncbi:MAG: hypothetical protein PVSMB2_35130 [Ktedonobacteraceae bacterium]
MQQEREIEIDVTHRIRVAPIYAFYPQHLVRSPVHGSGNVPGEGWEYYPRKGGGYRRFYSEKTARIFLEQEIAAEKLECWESTCTISPSTKSL